MRCTQGARLTLHGLPPPLLVWDRQHSGALDVWEVLQPADQSSQPALLSPE